MDSDTYSDIRPIPGCPGYFAGADGTIWSAMPGRWGKYESLHVLKPYRNRSGYLGVSLRSNGRRHSYLVHRLVATAFHGLRPDGMGVRHRNGNQLDNRAENLHYGTQAENIADRDSHGTTARGERQHLAKLTNEKVLAILSRLRAGESGKSLAREFGISTGTVSQLKTGRTWRHLSAEGTIQ